MFDLAVINAKIVSGADTINGNIYVKNEKICAITGEPLEEGSKRVIDAKGSYVIPGIIDEHVHIIDMGMNDLGRFEMDSEGAALGGVTTIMEMPLTVPPTTTLDAFMLKKERASKSLKVDYALYGGAVPGNYDEIIKMHEAGAVGFKCMMAGSVPGMFEAANSAELLEIYDAISSCDSIVAIHAENDDIIQNLENKLKASGKKDMDAFFKSRPIMQENEAVQRAIYLQQFSNCRTLIVHCSNVAAVEMVKKAQFKGMQVYCETGPHYLNLSEEDGKRVGPYMKFAPPARSKEETEKLWQQLAIGNIDTLGSDHGGHLKENKEKGWTNIWEAGNGALGLETFLPVMLSEGVIKGRITINRLVETMCENPAKLYKIFPQKGQIAVGADADMVLVDMDTEHIIDASKFRSFQKHSPFDGLKVNGKAAITIIRGHVVMENDEILVNEGFGKLVTPVKEG